MMLSNSMNVALTRCGDKGNGIIAKRPLRKGKLVASYIGKAYSSVREMLDASEIRDNTFLKNYSISSKNGKIIVPTVADLKKPGAHLANHSCNPNTYFDKALDLVAKRDIANGEELTVYYGWSGITNTICLCGEADCTGYIGIKTKIIRGSEPDENGNVRIDDVELDAESLDKTISTARLNGWLPELGWLFGREINKYPDLEPVIGEALRRHDLKIEEFERGN